MSRTIKIKDQKSRLASEAKRAKIKTKSDLVKTKDQGLKSGLNVDVYDVKGKVVETIKLPEQIFGKNKNDVLVSQAVRVYLANQRQGSASTKTRGEVKGSTRKIYRQKGTGRARHGSIRAPIFVHGGIVFGPKPRDYSIKLSKKMKKTALFTALSDKFRENNIKVISGLEKIEAKTREMVEVMKKLELYKDGKKVLLVIPAKSDNVYKAARNIEGIKIVRPSNMNTYEVLDSKMLLFMKNSIEDLSKNLLKGA